MMKKITDKDYLKRFKMFFLKHRKENPFLLDGIEYKVTKVEMINSRKYPLDDDNQEYEYVFTVNAKVARKQKKRDNFKAIAQHIKDHTRVMGLREGVVLDVNWK